MSYLPILALLAGAAIATQASMNAQLGTLLKSPALAVLVAFIASAAFSLVVFLFLTPGYPLMSDVKSVPIYLWFTGGALSTFGVGLFYFLIPKMGVGPFISLALTGQLFIAVIISHFGWFNSPVKPVNGQALVGAFALVIGVVLLNCGRSYG